MFELVIAAARSILEPLPDFSVYTHTDALGRFVDHCLNGLVPSPMVIQ
jgi:hypothetical protein